MPVSKKEKKTLYSPGCTTRTTSEVSLHQGLNTRPFHRGCQTGYAAAPTCDRSPDRRFLWLTVRHPASILPRRLWSNGPPSSICPTAPLHIETAKAAVTEQTKRRLTVVRLGPVYWEKHSRSQSCARASAPFHSFLTTKLFVCLFVFLLLALPCSQCLTEWATGRRVRDLQSMN